MSKLKQLIETIRRRNALSSFFWSESVTVYPAGQPAREIRASVRRTVAVESPGEQDTDAVTRVELLCLKDEADGELGGLSAPAVGDVVELADGVRVGFTGEVLENYSNMHKLVFERIDPKIGGPR